MILSEQELQTWLTLIRTTGWLNQTLARVMRDHNDHRMTEYDVLVHLLHAPDPAHGLRMNDLTERVIISKSGMTRVVDRLVEQEYVERRTYEDNRREVYAVLTDRGRDLAQHLMEEHQARLQTLVMQHIHADEHAVLQRVFRRIAAANEIYLFRDETEI